MDYGTRSILWWVLLALVAAGCRHGPEPRPERDPVEAARRLTREGKAEEALRRMDRRLEERPGDLAAHRARVEAAQAAGRLQELAKRYEAWLAVPSQAGLGHYGLGFVGLARGPGGMQAALEHLERAEAELGNESEIPYRIGRVLAMDGRHPAALEAYQRALTRGEPEAAVHIHLAASLVRLGRQPEAVEALRAAAALPLKPADAHTGRAVADEIYDPARGLPSEVAAEVHRAEDLLTQDLANQSLAALDALLARFPDTAYLHALRGLSHSRLQNHAEAIVAFERALELQPSNPTAELGLGDVYLRLERFPEARAAFERAVALDPFDAEAIERLASLAISLGDAGRAIPALERLCMLRPEDRASRHRLAQWYVRDQRLDAALERYQELTEGPDDDLAARLALARIYLDRAKLDAGRRAQHRKRALEELKRAEELSPDDQRLRDLRRQVED
jgi:tetratricopeptide (TPR) repeat protein